MTTTLPSRPVTTGNAAVTCGVRHERRVVAVTRMKEPCLWLPIDSRCLLPPLMEKSHCSSTLATEHVAIGFSGIELSETQAERLETLTTNYVGNLAEVLFHAN